MSDTIQRPQARELTQAEHDQWVSESVADLQAIRKGFMEARGGLWRAAEAMYHFSENSGWLALGYETVGEWLADPDITLSRRTYLRMIAAWRELVVVRGMKRANVGTLDLTKVDIVLPAIKAGSVVLEDAVSDIEVLGARDLREKYIAGVVVGETSYEPTGDGLDDAPEPVSYEPPMDVTPNGDEQSVVPLYVAQLAYGVLARVLAEVGPPERKALSGDLRNAIVDAIEFAHDHGVGLDA